MTNIQSVIVYRNPLEAAMWESGMIFPIILGVIISATVAVTLSKLFELYNKRGRGSRAWGGSITQEQSTMIVVASIATMIGTIFYFS